MDVNSLMNPDFLKEQLQDITDLLAKDETTVDEIRTDIDRIIDYFMNAEQAAGDFNKIALTPDQHRDIIRTLSKIRIETYTRTVSRRVTIGQYKQLLKDRRYRIATTILNLFK